MLGSGTNQRAAWDALNRGRRHFIVEALGSTQHKVDIAVLIWARFGAGQFAWEDECQILFKGHLFKLAMISEAIKWSHVLVEMKKCRHPCNTVVIDIHGQSIQSGQHRSDSDSEVQFGERTNHHACTSMKHRRDKDNRDKTPTAQNNRTIPLTSAATSGSSKKPRLLSSQYSTFTVGHSTEPGWGEEDREREMGGGNNNQSIE